MTAGTGNGKILRCDARCYNAKGPICNCCCGGKNHGVGFEQAVRNMKEEADEILKAYQEAHQGTEIHAQLVLF